LLLGVVPALALVPAVATPASATTALTYNTKFEIDGNPQVDSTGDWLSDAASYPSLRDNYVTTLGSSTGPGVEFCGNGTENQIIPGTKLAQVNVNDLSPFINLGNVNTKSDVCIVRRAWELVLVPADPSNPAAGGQYHQIVYFAWTRETVNGEIDVLVPVLGPDPTSQTDDFIVNYDFKDSTQTTDLSFLTWNGTTWVTNALPAGSYEAVTSENVTDPAAPGLSLTFGEFAVDVTAAGLLPEDGPCEAYSVGNVITRTGNSPSATLEDVVDVPPLNLTNCGSLEIIKQTRPTPATNKDFGYSVSEVDGKPVQYENVPQVTGTITVPPNPNSVVITDLLISPDYVVQETTLPAGWTQQSLVCTSFDPIAGQNVTRTLYSNGAAGPDASFPTAPGVQATCTISNVGPPSVSLTKTVDPVSATGWSFDFTIDPVPTGETATKTVTSAKPTITWDNLTAGVQYTITETGVAAGYQAGTITCTPGTGSSFTPDPGQVITCAATNEQLAKLTVVKSASPADDTLFSFELFENGNPIRSGLLGAQTPPATFNNLVPGGTYLVRETLTQDQLAAGWKLVGADCVDALDGTAFYGTVTATGGEVTVTTKAGSDITCNFVNVQGASITIAKVADPLDPTQIFNFDVVNPDGSTGTVNVGAPLWQVTVGNLVPGSYTVTELVPDGWQLERIVCAIDDKLVGEPAGDSGRKFELEAGQNAICRFDNFKSSTVTVKKTTVPGGGTGFDFTLSDIGPGGGADLPSAMIADGDSFTWLDLLPSTFELSEKEKDGWFLSNLVCEGTDRIAIDYATRTAEIKLAVGDDVVCTFENTEYGSITVDKVTNPAGDPTEFDFTTTGLTPADFTLTDAGAPQVFPDLVPGTYTVTELAEAGWLPIDPDTELSCDTGTWTATNATVSITLAAGEDVTCTYTNTKAATITVVKQTDPAGSAQAFDFTTTGLTPSSFLLTDNPAAIGDPFDPAVVQTFPALRPGSYGVAETVPAGWRLVGLDCASDQTENGGIDTFAALTEVDPATTIDLAAGENVVCTYTNEQLASVSVTKTVTPAGTTGWSVGFTIDPVPAGETATKTATSAAPTVTWNGLVPGTSYTVTETVPADLKAGTLTCGTTGSGTFTPTAGQAVTCSVTNEAITNVKIDKVTNDPTMIGVGSKDTDETSFTLTVTNTGKYTARSVQVTDTMPQYILIEKVTPSAGSCTNTTTSLTCNLGDLAAGASVTIVVDVSADPATPVTNENPSITVTNTAKVTTTSLESDPNDNQDSSDVTIIKLPDTGGDPWPFAQVALVLAALGGALVLVSRRRRVRSIG
jgi:uncharacterized repeat protein (TIGR01451 family)